MSDQAAIFAPYDYQIVVTGHLDRSWAAWLDCLPMRIEAEEYDQTPVTVLTGPILDQAALRGLLNRLFDLNLTVLSVNRCNQEIGAHKN